MGGAEFGTAKYLSKKLKAKGLQKLRFYCQVCEKQCRDENGFKSHNKSPSHERRIAQLKPQDVDMYTEHFEKDFLRLLRISHGEKKIEANKFYNEFIQDRDHIHMNATRFHSLTKFILHLGKTGKVRLHGLDAGMINDLEVDEGKILISYIDDSYENMMRQDKLRELEKSESSEQDLKIKILKKQMEEGKKEADMLDSEDEGDRQKTTNMLPVGKISLTLSKPGDKGKVTKKRKNVFKSPR
ncbi:Rts2p [Lachancea thermotolerans CBS 6340]|uniref:KLTH0F18018p n=1 Tax=Lachancea thermotolerans (strain ATCC 56472 / CBS 6340 / NRRL Y-8284) TaxID=559295 RepID=C5DJP2_LACTC|nr:KLTH0F18018p [Lachancea thermotolerans CBS 6340]CAR24531.1 KLTH0F18018p [Lachancea thermotolerans CBS 6340]